MAEQLDEKTTNEYITAPLSRLCAEVQREVKLTRLTGSAIGKGDFRHFMEKELHEHPAAIGDTLHRMVNPATRAVALPELPFDRQLPRITISACGSAFYAGLVGRWWFEAIARIPADVDVASEFRYRTPPLAEAGWASWSASRARPPTPWRRCATCGSRGSTCCRS